MPIRLLLLLVLSPAVALAEEPVRSIRVFVALCDNATQGIQKVGAIIGDGDVPDANLYWGCSDGLGSYFARSKRWKLREKKSDVDRVILRRLVLDHVDGRIVLVAEAYRGSEMRRCLQDFEKAVASGEHDLVAFIGHNGLMDFRLPAPTAGAKATGTDTIVLCCLSQSYFTERLQGMGSRPILLTDQFMYPGSFLLHDAIEVWKGGGSLEAIRTAAGKAYAKNQKISVRAATGVFANLTKKSE